MPKIAKMKTDAQLAKLRNRKKRAMYTVGGVPGLLMQVTGKGNSSGSWVLRVAIGTRLNTQGEPVPHRHDVGLGSCADMGVEAARAKAYEYRAQFRQGIDPREEARAARDALAAERRRKITFEQAARQTHAAKAADFRNEKHRKDWISSIERYANPIIGNKRVAEIDTSDVKRVLDQIWMEKPATAKKLLQRLQLVFDWARVTGVRDDDANPAAWEGNLKVIMPKQPRQHGHHKALPWKQVPEFMAQLRNKRGTSPLALEFAILTGARSGEVRGMTWAEVDLQEGTWTVPAERMKAGKAHTVPLSPAAMAVLRDTPREDDGLVFRAPRGGQLSDMALNQICRRMAVEAVPHGFRASFKDWSRDNSTLADEVSELCLAHVDSNATRAAYARGGLLDKRREMLEAWAAFVAPEAVDNVTRIHEARA